MEKFPWNSMEIDILILHGIPWRFFTRDVKEKIDAPIVTNSHRHSGNIPRAFVSTGSSMFSLISSSAIFRGRG